MSNDKPPERPGTSLARPHFTSYRRKRQYISEDYFARVENRREEIHLFLRTIAPEVTEPTRHHTVAIAYPNVGPSGNNPKPQNDSVAGELKIKRDMTADVLPPLLF